ncbi:ABC transporter permease [Microbacterium sp. C7(2022)]|uniref:ABC transporter permease n=1 Tax=Microbacterium sp. C7(2022) TaxID=2992759 RepID=UPI00237AED74|nr:ABC transporter permease subunit [Microbacterium sp. C7(2022)]MDE0547426.1 ABC transporter permease subunit [Microbacterium sp. C7(2022)]
MTTSISVAKPARAAAVAAIPVTRKRGARARRVVAAIWPPVVVFALVLAGWYAVSYLALAPERRFLLPPPHEVVVSGFFDPIAGPTILTGLLQTALVAAVGLGVAVVVGVAWGIAMSQARWAERSLFPYAVLLQCIPILALVPLVGFWFGFGFFARVIVCALMALFPIVSNTLFGLRSVDPRMRDLFALQRASSAQVLFKLELPAALPAMFAGLRISAGLAVVGAIVADFFFRQGTAGIGTAISRYQAMVQGPPLFAAIIAAALLGIAVFVFFGWLSRRVVGAWHDSAS